MTRQRETPATRRSVLRTTAAVAGGLTLGGAAVAGSAAAEKPDFSPRVWGDGEQWGTKVTGTFDEPNNLDALDRFFVVTNSNNPAGQLPVSEAAPGNNEYNGGRWYTHTVTWTESGFEDHGTVPVLTRYGPADDPESILFHKNLGHLTIEVGSPEGGPPPFFRCPLLPVKE